MIQITSRDPLILWNDLCATWLSGQEPGWIDEKVGPRYYSYNNLMVCRWDYFAMEGEGERIRMNLALPSPQIQRGNLRVVRPVEIESTSWGHIHYLKKEGNKTQIHVYLPLIEMPKGYMKIMLSLNQILKERKVVPMTPIALHSTALYFNRTNLAYFYLLFGRRSFLDPALSMALIKDIGRLSKILSDGYENLAHKGAWMHAVKMLGRDNIL